MCVNGITATHSWGSMEEEEEEEVMATVPHEDVPGIIGRAINME